MNEFVVMVCLAQFVAMPFFLWQVACIRDDLTAIKKMLFELKEKNDVI